MELISSATARKISNVACTGHWLLPLNSSSNTKSTNHFAFYSLTDKISWKIHLQKAEYWLLLHLLPEITHGWPCILTKSDLIQAGEYVSQSIHQYIYILIRWYRHRTDISYGYVLYTIVCIKIISYSLFYDGKNTLFNIDLVSIHLCNISFICMRYL